MNLRFLGWLLLISGGLHAQSMFRATVKDQATQQPLPGVSVYLPALEKGAVTDPQGTALVTQLPAGTYDIRFRYVGYATVQVQRTFPLADSLQGQTFYLTPSAEAMEEVTITSTRSTRTIADLPTRVEFIAGEELAEKGNMKPGDIRMLLNESTGIQTQQTSATSYNSSIRIQGLDGKYTQLLRDGLPLYSGFSGGLSLMQIAPLDLRQVEVIKGSVSTLYGGGAIAGLVNLVSKTPEEGPEVSFLFNGTSALGLDASGFYAEKWGKVGATAFVSYNKGTPYDPADLGLTAIPKFDRLTVHPRLFFYPSERTTAYVGVTLITEDRLGGNLAYVRGEPVTDPYFERNRTARLSTEFSLTHQVNDYTRLTVKNAISHYDRQIDIPAFTFAGTQLASFSEVNLSHVRGSAEWVAGLNLWTDQFSQAQGETASPLDYQHTTVGGFVQNTWRVSEQFSLESGLRTDYQLPYGWFVLPRLSLMYRPVEALTLRLGGGGGYKTPTLFSEEAERLQFRNLLPLGEDTLRAERSRGGNLDVNYRLPLTEELLLTLNTLTFYTQIQDPLALQRTETGYYAFQQPDGYVDTKGVEVNLKWSYHDLNWFVGYTYADVREHRQGQVSRVPRVARHRLNNVLMYEQEENFWIGLEAYYYSPQPLSDGQTGRAYWILGLMSEKQWGEHFSVFLNFENFLDTRQTAFDTIYTGSLSDPQFRDIYAPVDGFVINGGIKLKW
ncbi:iron complex outermembrane recepter protein [Catalinimonas alkaloidigena]|uniref:Iron complex outermembrane recepter protein n=1 Tax=Catalinimonas alkaloidigena TaxID=1075417 RepID=A0A1G9TRW1_9BACT|nr:TonB-dependent receptor [Catalinimonas alkaloidigena]SDM49895.1 iron complex outermembrane recepter protein [Catalinimonas alkaloidigena]